MPKRKQTDVEQQVDDEVPPEPKPEKVVKKTKPNPKTVKNTVDEIDVSSTKELCDVFAQYMHLFTRSKNFFDKNICKMFFNDDDDSGEFVEALATISKHKDLLSDTDAQHLITVNQYKTQQKRAKLGFNNAIISSKLLPFFKVILDKMIHSYSKEITTTAFIKLVEENMHMISENYKGNIKDEGGVTIELLTHLTNIYEQAWSQTFLKQSNFTSSKDYIMASSNRIHALYWHIKPSIVSKKLEFKVKTFD